VKRIIQSEHETTFILIMHLGGKADYST